MFQAATDRKAQKLATRAASSSLRTLTRGPNLEEMKTMTMTLMMIMPVMVVSTVAISSQTTIAP